MDVGTKGTTAFSAEGMCELLKNLNEAGLDLHLHTVGKDADYLVFDKDLLTVEQEGFSHNKPTDVYFAGKKVN